MIEELSQSSGDTLGFKMSGDVTKEDYAVLTPAVAAAVASAGKVNLLLDLTEFHWENVGAWGDDLHFGHEYHDKIERMALVGNRKWEEHLANLCTPFYAKAAEYFDNDSEAWEWLAG